METLIQDLRFGIRRLLASPGFTFIAILSLALGIGANTAIFSLVNTILLRPLPVAQPEQVVAVNQVDLRNPSGFANFSYPNYVDFRDRNEVLSGMYAHRFVPLSLSRGGNNERVWGYLVSGNYFDVLGVSAFKGRLFSQEDDRAPGAHPVAVVSYGGWQRRFGSDPDLVGKTILLNGHTFTVIGIAPENFTGTELIFTPEIWVPMMMARQIEPGSNWLERRGTGVLFAGGRLKPGVTAAQAEAALNVLSEQLAREYPSTNEDKGIQLTPPGLIIPQFRNSVISFAGVLMATVGLVLLIACANLANLLLARASARRKEIAIRLALGAGRLRLIRQLLTESVLLALMGGLVGLLLALWLVDLIAAFRPPIDFPLTIALQVDYRVLGFTLLLSFATGVLFGLAPALQATKPDLVPALKDETGAAGYRRSRLRNSLVVAQVALSLILLIAAGLIVRSLQHVQMIGPGFETERAIAMSVDPGLQGYTRERGQEFYRQLIERVEALPGVRSATLASYLPLGLNVNTNGIYIEGQPPTRGAETPEALTSNVGPRYFETMGIPLVAGREFTERDKPDAPLVAVVNETFARRFWPGESAVGKRFSFSREGGPFMEIVGVAKDGKYFSLGEAPAMFAYISLSQVHESSATLVVRTAADPQSLVAAIRREIQQLDANLPVFDVKTLDEHMSLSLFPMRIGAAVVGSFGLLALTLAAIGIYGVMAYSVSRRTREIGIRMALGAERRDVLRMIVGQGMKLASVGMGIGLLGALALTRLMSSVLYGVSATDVMTFTIVTLMLTLIVLLACYIPARRATKVDPMIALRYE
ncbi:MAG TPA: ABC transporter permease [Blastocatellia bacterium]|nr:ABC transporter permease [Blastocatellia bacterium]